MQKVQKLHDNDFLQPAGMCDVNVIKLLYLLNLGLDWLVVLFQMEFWQFVLVLDRLLGVRQLGE